MNEHEIARLAAALHQARPDWPTKQLTTLMSDSRMIDRPRRDVFVALAWVACESGTSSPYRVLESGPWWKAAGVTGEVSNRHPSPASACRTCGGDPSTCAPRGCDNPSTRPVPRDPDGIYATEVARARELLTTRTSGHREGGSA